MEENIVFFVCRSLLEPCTGCAPPYGYKHVMKLSTDTSQFAVSRRFLDNKVAAWKVGIYFDFVMTQSLVRAAPVSGNLDAPEGGFDAIMQAIVCRNNIGWREKARRLLVFSTDAGFHYAGDGKLGGIIRPNDGLCHLDNTGLYTHSSLQDYPSISQINLAVKKNAINIIWAVTDEQISIYKRLSKHVEGSFAGILANDSSNVVELIREQYDKISSSVEMKDTASSSIKVRYLSSCLGGGPPVETSKCDGLKVGTKVEFIAEIEVTSCPKNRSEWKQTFEIYPVSQTFRNCWKNTKKVLAFVFDFLFPCPVSLLVTISRSEWAKLWRSISRCSAIANASTVGPCTRKILPNAVALALSNVEFATVTNVPLAKDANAARILTLQASIKTSLTLLANPPMNLSSIVLDAARALAVSASVPNEKTPKKWERFHQLLYFLASHNREIRLVKIMIAFMIFYL